MYTEQGLDHLALAVENGPVDDRDGSDLQRDLEDACELAHLARRQWDAVLTQLDACRRLTRRQLGLTDDGVDQIDDLHDGTTHTTAIGLRTFLRHLAATVVSRSDDVSVVAAELHGIVYGPEAAYAPVTWQDYRLLLVGGIDQPDWRDVRAAVDLLRSGAGAEEVARLVTGFTLDRAQGLSRFLGIHEWRRESKERAARAAAQQGLTAQEFRASYNQRMDGYDQMGERSARQYLSEAKREREAA